MANQHYDRDPKKSDTPSNEIRTSSSSNKIPTPLDFDRFIPWLMLEIQSCVTVSVKRVDQRIQGTGREVHGKSETEEYPQKESLKRFSSKLKQVKFNESTITSASSKNMLNQLEDEADTAVNITAFYDQQGSLAEIAFLEHPVPIHRQVLKAVALCLPFHKLLNKLTIRRKKLDCGIIYEISKLLPFSKLTDICLDHCNVLQQNFYILLDNHTPLKHLSLSDCNIGDHACIEIAERIEAIRPASKNLRVLNLSFNSITNVGAEALGRSLRTNRRLLHLNLCNNSINEIGAAHILLPLSEFTLFPEEMMMYEDRRLHYIQEKLDNAERCLKQITVNDNDERGTNLQQQQQQRHKEYKDVKHSKSVHSKKRRSSREGSVEVKGTSDVEVTERVAVVQCNDAFHPSNLILRRDSWFSIGNLVLCSLNLAYNHLDLSCIERLVDVLSYQRHLRSSIRTGLLRVVIEGNDLPVSCVEYDIINMYLKQGMKHMMPYSPTKKRQTSATGQKERRKSSETRE